MAAILRLLMASTPLLTSSLRNTSWPEVDGLFDDREDVFGVDLNLTLFVQHRHDNNVKA
jgi:hypothetical protein